MSKKVRQRLRCMFLGLLYVPFYFFGRLEASLLSPYINGNSRVFCVRYKFKGDIHRKLCG